MPSGLKPTQWREIANTVLTRSLGLRRGMCVVIEVSSHTVDSAEAVALEARRLGIRPILLHAPESLLVDSLKVASPTDVNAISRGEFALAASCDGYIRFPASPDELQRRDSVPHPYRRALDRRRLEWNRALVRNSVPSVQLMAGDVTPELARHFGVDLDSWRRTCLRSCLVPPRTIQKVGRPLARRLQRGRRITITHSNGTRLELGLAGRSPFIDDGVVDDKDRKSGWMGTTVPGGYLTVAVDERVGEGCLISNLTSHSQGRIMGGIAWTFRNGRLVDSHITVGRARFDRLYRQAGRERSRPAVLYFGLNPEIHDFPRVEDQGLGTVGLDIGHNEDYGGTTRGSFRQYALLRGGAMSIDGQKVRWPRPRR